MQEPTAFDPGISPAQSTSYQDTVNQMLGPPCKPWKLGVQAAHRSRLFPELSWVHYPYLCKNESYVKAQLACLPASLLI